MDEETAPKELHDLLDQAWKETRVGDRKFKLWARSGYYVIEFDDLHGTHHVGVPTANAAKFHRLKTDRSFRPKRPPWGKVEN